MLKKSIILLLFTSVLLTQALIFPPRPRAAQNSELIEIARLLPDSEVIVALDYARAYNVAAPALLNQDASKLAHLKDLMQTFENNFSIDPSEIRQLALGASLPPDPSKPSSFGLDFTLILRTEHDNSALIENLGKRVDAIEAFDREKAPTRRYINEFRDLRDYKPVASTPESVAAAVKSVDEALKKTAQINNLIDSFPKRPVSVVKNAGYVRKNNQSLAAYLNKMSEILKSETDVKDLRAASIKLLNRWNAVKLEDSQRNAKLKAILAESETIYPNFKRRNFNAQKIEALFGYLLPEAAENADAPTPLLDEINAKLDEALTQIKNKELSASSKTLEEIDVTFTDKIEAMNANYSDKISDSGIESNDTNAAAEKSFSEKIKQSAREEKLNGKRLTVFVEDTPKTEPSKNKSAKTDTQPARVFDNVAIGYLDNKTMIVGFEKSIRKYLLRDASVKNDKIVEMLNAPNNALLAFAFGSNTVKKLAAEASKDSDQQKNDSISFFTSSFFTEYLKDINIFGSVNFDDTGSLTNDVSMTLGFVKSVLPETARLPKTDASNPNLDNSFEIGGFQFEKNIFYDLLTSFRAMSGSMTFKFDKQKVVGLVRNVPKMIDRIKADAPASKKEVAKTFKPKPQRLGAIQDLLTSPQLYVDLAKIFGKEG